MIDYNKINDVLDELEECVENMGQLSDTQNNILNVSNSISTIVDEIKSIRDTINKYTDSIENIDANHVAIKDDIETVLQDYKKLHSSFEFMEVELKKFDTMLQSSRDSILSKVEETKDKIGSGIDVQTSVIKKLHEQNDQILKRQKGNRIIMIVGACASAIAVILGVVGLII